MTVRRSARSGQGSSPSAAVGDGGAGLDRIVDPAADAGGRARVDECGDSGRGIAWVADDDVVVGEY